MLLGSSSTKVSSLPRQLKDRPVPLQQQPMVLLSTRSLALLSEKSHPCQTCRTRRRNEKWRSCLCFSTGSRRLVRCPRTKTQYAKRFNLGKWVEIRKPYFNCIANFCIFLNFPILFLMILYFTLLLFTNTRMNVLQCQASELIT